MKIKEAVGLLLAKHRKTAATAESCTGGYVAHQLTSIPGSSAYFRGGVVSYDNSIKESILGVENKIISEHGAVSEETVRAMANGVKKLMKTDYAISISGIMGPGGGTAEKPVGTVWIAVAGLSETVAQKFTVRFDRMRNIEITAIYALNMLRQSILKENDK